MKNKKLLSVIILLLLFNRFLLAQIEIFNCIEEPAGGISLGKTTSITANPDQPEGYILPSIGTVNVLMVFAKFPDDTYDTLNTIWPKNGTSGDPENMNNWVDQTWSSNPTQGSLTHYFNDMSMEKLKFTGRVVSVTSPRTRQEYLDSSFTRGFIQKEIIEGLDITWDFAQFDNWDLDSAFQHTNTPDGIVDMIIFVWRNIAKEYPTGPPDSVSIIETNLGFATNYGTLAGSEFTVDGGVRTVKTGFFPNNSAGIPGGSGVTIRNYVSYGKDQTFSIVIHEFAHYLLGNNDYHSGFGFWGMLHAWGVKNKVANSFERHRLDWITLVDVDTNSGTILNANLTDFVTTGSGYRLNIDTSTDQYFYIENHQSLNYWENNLTFGNVENGIYLISQDGLRPSRSWGSADERNSKYLKCIPADGRYNWSVNQQTPNPWGSGNLPVFRNDGTNSKTGYHDLEYIPHLFPGLTSPTVIHFTEDGSGNPIQDIRHKGDGTDAFRMNHNTHFNPWSNPNNQRADRTITQFGFTITNESSGIYTLNIYSDLNENVIPAGTWNFQNNLTVNAGDTLTIQPGAILTFENNTKLIVNGNLIAQGISSNPITFTSTDPNPSYNDWYGIEVNGSAASIILDYCTVEYATYGIRFNNGAMGTVSNSTIKNNYYGIYAFNADPVLNNCNITNNNYGIRAYSSYDTPSWNTVHISSSNINNNNSYGLYFINSSPTLSNNSVHNNGRGAALWYGDTNPIFEGNSFTGSTYYGVACYGGPSPNFNYNSSHSFGGYNTITSNSAKGVRITGSSNPNFGETQSSLGGYNSIYGNTGYEIDNTTGSTIMAQNNWWGSVGPQSGEFNGSILYFRYLNYDPNGGSQSRSSMGFPEYAFDENSDLPEDLQIASFKQNISEYKTSADMFKEHFEKNKKSKYVSYASVQYLKSLKYNQKPKAIIEEIEKTLSKKQANEVQYELLSGEASNLVLIKRPMDAIDKLDEALNLKISKTQKYRLLANKAMIIIYELNEI